MDAGGTAQGQQAHGGKGHKHQIKACQARMLRRSRDSNRAIGNNIINIPVICPVTGAGSTPPRPDVPDQFQRLCGWPLFNAEIGASVGFPLCKPVINQGSSHQYMVAKAALRF